MSFEHISTQRDIMKETLIYGAELDGKYGFPALSEYNASPSKTVDIHRSKKLIQVKDLNLNFFVHDYMLNPIWNNTDKYIEHLKCFGSVCGFDFTIDVNSPLALQIYNKYRNHVLSWYLQIMALKSFQRLIYFPIALTGFMMDCRIILRFVAVRRAGHIVGRRNRNFQNVFKKWKAF